MAFRRRQFLFHLTSAAILFAQTGASFHRHVVDRGIAVDLSLDPIGGSLRENDDVRVEFKLSDAATASPVTAAFPSAWIQRVGASKPTCDQVVGGLLNSGTTGKADVDLNSYYVLALNNDATVTVVDPLFGYGGTKLLALVALPAPGEDWALAPTGDQLFVTVPDAGELTAVDTTTWKVEAHIPLPARPRRVSVQPDGAYAWVTLDSADDSQPAVAVISTSTYQPVAQIPAGAGEHTIAFSADSRWAALTSSAAGTATLLDVAKLKKVRDFKAGAEPVSVAFSTAAGMFYVADRAAGSILVIEPSAAREVARIPAEPGLGQIKFDPGGRRAFLVNPEKDLLHILDSASNQIVQTAGIKQGPDQVNFSGGIAYVRCRRSETVQMIPLDGIGKPGKLVPLGDFPGGQHPFGEVAHPSPADGFVRAPGENAMLVANPADKAIYYFKEGLPAPMGSFANYSREPRAILVVDRSLKQRVPGVFQTIARLPVAGDYFVALLVDSPRIVQCFAFTVQPNPALSARGPRVKVELAALPASLRPGQPVRVRIRLTATDGAHPANLTDVRILAILESASWHYRFSAEPEGDGVYAVDLIPPAAGRYRLAVECPSQGLAFNSSPQFFVDVPPAPDKK